MNNSYKINNSEESTNESIDHLQHYSPINLVSYVRRTSDDRNNRGYSKAHARTQTDDDKQHDYLSDKNGNVNVAFQRDEDGSPAVYFAGNDHHRIGTENNWTPSEKVNHPSAVPSTNGNGDLHLRKNNYSVPIARLDKDLESGCSWAKERLRRCCSRKTLYKRIPGLYYLKNYTTDMILSDLVAGITAGLTMIPQAIAYSNVAGIPPEYGLFSAFVGCMVYAVLGSCKVSSIGPTAIQAILVRENIHGLGHNFAILLCFITGLVQLVMGVLQLGFLVDFISGPVSVGFTSAAAIIIASTQMKDLLGLNFPATKFLEVWDQLAEHIKETKIYDFTLGMSCMIVLILLRKVKDIHIGPADTKDKTIVQRVMAMVLWFISAGRNIFVVLLCAAIAYYFNPPLALSSDVKPGLPEIKPPPFSATVANRTYGFLDMTSKLGSGIIILPLLSLLEDVSGAKVFSDGKPIDATQELLALGSCNLLSSFAGSMSLSAALSRAAVNNASGVNTTFGSIYAALIILISLQYLSPYFHYIPKASLAAVIIAAVVFMVEFHVVKPMWRTKKLDLIPAAATFLSCLFLRLEFGIFIGVGINVLFLLYASARPSVQVEKHKSEWGYEYIVITPDRSLAFPSVEYVRSVVSKVGLKQGYSSMPVVIDSKHVHGADFTAAKGIKSLIEDFVKRNQPLLFYNLKPSVVETFQGVQPSKFIYCQSEQELHDMLKGYYFRSGNNTVKDCTADR